MMDSYNRAEYIRGRLGTRSVVRKIGYYAMIAVLLGGVAYAADKFDVSKKVDGYYSKYCKGGIERLIGK